MNNRRYHILDEIGQGAMGTVYHAIDRLTGHDVALKRVMPQVVGTTMAANDDQTGGGSGDRTRRNVEAGIGERTGGQTGGRPDEQPRTGSTASLYTIHPEATGSKTGEQTLISSGSPGSTSDTRLALAREFRLLSSLHHPNIIRVLDYGFEAHQLPFYTMERVPEPLSVVDAAQDEPLEVKIGLLIQMLQALAYLHRRGVIHRDIKPSNALVDGDQVKLLDFGISELREQSATQEGITGTISYMAPELLQGHAASEASDLFAVGVVAYQLLTGVHPFKAPSLTLMMVNITKGEVDFDTPALDPRLVPVLKGLLTVDPEERYNDAQRVMTDLSAALGLPTPRESAAIRDSFLKAAKLVGRRREMGLMAEHLSKAMVGLGGGILIGGESGVGKTRLLDELRTLALVKGALVLDGQEVRQGNSPYQVWRQPMRRLCLELELDDETARTLLPLVPDLPELLGRDLETREELDPVASKKRLHETVSHLFEERTEPTVVLLEDLQWSGTESLELLAQVQTIAKHSPLLLIATFRNDEKPDLPNALSGLESIQLQRLSPRAIEELSFSMLGEAGRKDTVLDLLRRETEGNVFFIVEVARALAEEAGQLHSIELEKVPQHISTGGIQRILRRRLGRVPESARPLLEVAAVAGRELDLPLLRHLAARIEEGPERLGPWLRICVDAAVLEVQGDDWRFAHDKLRDNLLQELDPRQSRSLHRLIGDALMELHGDDPERLAAQAFHFRAAAGGGDPQTVEKAIDRLSLAGQQAVDSCLTVAALDSLGEALRLLETQPITKARLRREAELQNELGAAYLMSKGHAATEVRDCFERSRTLCEQLGDEYGVLPVLLGLWRHHVVRGELDLALELAEQFVESAEAENDPAFIVLADSALGTSLMYQGETKRSWRHFERSIESYGALPDDAKRRAAQAFSYGQNPGVANLVYGACNLWCLGSPDQALERCRQGLALADQLAHPFSQAFASVIAAWVHQFRREYELAGERALRAIELSKAQGFQLFLAVGSVLYGWSLAMQDQEEKGIAMLEQTLGLLRQSGSELLRPYFLALLAEAHGRAGALDQGRAAISEAIEIAERSGQGWWLPEIHRLDGELLMMQHEPDLDNAEVRFEKALGLAWQRGERGLALRAALSLAQLRHQKDAPDPARPLREVCEQFTEGFDTADLQAASLVLSMGT